MFLIHLRQMLVTRVVSGQLILLLSKARAYKILYRRYVEIHVLRTVMWMFSSSWTSSSSSTSVVCETVVRIKTDSLSKASTDSNESCNFLGRAKVQSAVVRLKCRFAGLQTFCDLTWRSSHQERLHSVGSSVWVEEIAFWVAVVDVHGGDVVAAHATRS